MVPWAITLLLVSWAIPSVVSSQLCAVSGNPEPVVGDFNGKVKLVGFPAKVRIVTAPPGTQPKITISNYSTTPNISVEGGKVTVKLAGTCGDIACDLVHMSAAWAALTPKMASVRVSENITLNTQAALGTAAVQVPCVDDKDDKEVSASHRSQLFGLSWVISAAMFAFFH
mmetsp:Transcript_35315/g.77179  ORF Transcript_35315/g.77179 Transcript_35315/m.77179 type:complete len:170 (-) Transcript_35315:346-855(-)